MSSPNESGKNETIFTGAYGEFGQNLPARIRRETYGEDLGQFSWITAEEFRNFLRRLNLQASSHLLDVACGSGGPALRAAQDTGCQVTGVDINESGIETARHLAETRGLRDRAKFELADAARPLPYADGSFDAIISIDAMNHLRSRDEVFAEWRRLLRPGGSFLFTDAVVVTGILSREEILARSIAMGQFLFTPAGAHERQIEAAGFVDLAVEDVTETIAAVSQRWHEARARHRVELLQTETAADFETLQTMLAAAHTLASEHRLSRFAYSAKKAPADAP